MCDPFPNVSSLYLWGSRGKSTKLFRESSKLKKNNPSSSTDKGLVCTCVSMYPYWG